MLAVNCCVVDKLLSTIFHVASSRFPSVIVGLLLVYSGLVGLLNNRFSVELQKASVRSGRVGHGLGPSMWLGRKITALGLDWVKLRLIRFLCKLMERKVRFLLLY